jgi:hypothetical protein
MKPRETRMHYKEDSMAKRTFQLLFIAFLVANTLWAANDPFVGRWKLNPSKSTEYDYMKVKSLGGNKYALDLGGGSWENVVADGTDQPEGNGTTVSVTVQGPFNWKVVRKKNGHVIVTGNWTLSQDAKTLSDHFSANRPNGSIFREDYQYKRTAAGSGFVGTWLSTSEPHSAFELQIRPYVSDGLSLIFPPQSNGQNLKFDGKDYPDPRPNAPPGYTSSARRVNERSLEVTHKIKGKVTDTWELTVSDGLKTMHLAVGQPSLSKPSLYVFDRE